MQAGCVRRKRSRLHQTGRRRSNVGTRGRFAFCWRPFIAASNELLDLAKQCVASRLTRSEEAIWILVGPLRSTMEVEPKVEPLTDPHHFIEKPPPPMASEDEVYPECHERHRENGAVLQPIDQQLELEDDKIPDRDLRQGIHIRTSLQKCILLRHCGIPYEAITSFASTDGGHELEAAREEPFPLKGRIDIRAWSGHRGYPFGPVRWK